MNYISFRKLMETLTEDTKKVLTVAEFLYLTCEGADKHE